MEHDALGAHTRDELGISEVVSARPIQAAVFSACSFALGATLPLLVLAFTFGAAVIPLVAGSSLLFLAILGGVAAQAGGASVITGAVRVLFWGAIAMAATALIGKLFGTTIG
jgi:VIT1/CCC1 family predicted Fe2+/Mn2+ transporter